MEKINKKQIINEAGDAAGIILVSAFYLCELETHMHE